MPRLLICCGMLLTAACALTSPDPSRTVSIETHEGTMLAFDVSPDDSTIVFELLGQLWTLPGKGGSARALTDAVRDTAEDLDPAFSPDGKTVVFRAERRGRTGLWLLELESGSIRQLTQRTNPDEYEGGASWSPDGRTIAFTHVGPDSATGEWHNRIRLLDVASATGVDLRIDAKQKLDVRDPAWTPDGKQIAFVAAGPGNQNGGRIWIVDPNGGRAEPLSADSTRGVAPAFAPDGKRIAFLGRDSASRLQVWVQNLEARSAPVRLTNHEDVASTRVRWTHDGNAILYAADGGLHRIGARGLEAQLIPFTAQLTIRRSTPNLRQVFNTDPVNRAPARAFLGLALSPGSQ